MTSPPRTIERLLSGLGAQPDFRNAVLGDLAEEYALRVENDGIDSAVRWYRREAMRAVPHLLRSWLRGVHARDVGHVAGVITTAYTGMVLTFGLLAGAIIGVASTLGYRGPQMPLVSIIGSGALLSGMMLLSLIMGTTAGYLAAWIDSRTPLVSAATFGALILFVQLTMQFAFGGPTVGLFPVWYRAGAPILGCVGAVVGGVLRVRRGELT